MSYITREDGERFVIPSYRDVLTAKQGSQLKREILLLSQSYGEYITLQRKIGSGQYDIAFSPDTGYLLGETVWNYFKRPQDLIYCEAIPNTHEAILVIVKAGSVYLDGSFPVENIPEELVIFLTQENNFDIYIHGDVPISEQPEAGKFSFEADSVHSFTVLDKPAFPALPLLKIYQLRLVTQVLKEQGIGALPVKSVIFALLVAGFLYYAWSYLFAPAPVVVVQQKKENPYQAFLNALSSPAPDKDVSVFVAQMQLLYSMPGWSVKQAEYTAGSLSADVLSYGGTTKDLFNWAENNGYTVNIVREGFIVTTNTDIEKRRAPNTIYPIKTVLGNFLDRMVVVLPGNNYNVEQINSRGVYKDVRVGIRFTDLSLLQISMFGDQLKDLPMVVQNISVTAGDQSSQLSGTITLLALGN